MHAMKGIVARVAEAVFMLAFGTLQTYAGVTVTKYHEVSRVVNGTTVTAACRVEFHSNKSVAPSGTITVIRPARPEGAHN
jgi:hypothetical protein